MRLRGEGGWAPLYTEVVRRPRPAFLLIAAAVLAVLLFWLLGRGRPRSSGAAGTGTTASAPGAGSTEAGLAPTGDPTAATVVYAHNLELRKGPQFRIYVRWLRGRMVRTSAKKNPSFDDPDSFVLEIDRGVIRANIGDVGNFLNSSLPKGSPLTGISIQPEGEQLKLRGMLHKVVPLPVELVGILAPLPDGRVQFHVNKINVLKIPMKKLLGGLHVALSDMVSASSVPGVQVSGNDIFFDTQTLMPPPHIRGKITSVRVAVPDIEVIYGAAPNDEGELAAWHNFLRLNGGDPGFWQADDASGGLDDDRRIAGRVVRPGPGELPGAAGERVYADDGAGRAGDLYAGGGGEAAEEAESGGDAGLAEG